MVRRLVTVAAVAGVVFTVWIAAPNEALSPNRVATCPVRLSSEALSAARAVEADARRFERVRFPIVRTLLADGGVEIVLPAALRETGRYVEVVDWEDCTIAACATAPAICALWDAGLPMRLAPTRKCLRAKFDAGLMCPLTDGGTFGDRNVTPASMRLSAAQCEQVECVIDTDSDPEVDL